MKTTVTVAGRKVDYDLKAELKIDPGALQAEFVEQPRAFAKWGALAIEARYQEEQAALAVKAAKANADADVRERMETANEKVTEPKVAAGVLLEQGVLDAEEGLREARRTRGLCDVAAESFRQRLQMLIGLGANYRTEAGLDPSIVSEQKAAGYAAKQAATAQAETTKAGGRKKPLAGKRSTT